jgi:hypothetical protein
MIPDDTFLQDVGMSPHLTSIFRNIIAYFPEFEGNRAMNFGNVRAVAQKRIHFDVGIFEDEDFRVEWDIFLTASSCEEAALKCRRHFLLKEIDNRKRSLASAKKSVKTQERKLAELRAQLEDEA